MWTRPITSTPAAAFLGRHGRLLVLCMLSLLLHLALIAWIDRTIAPPPSAGFVPLAVRLVDAAPQPPVPASTPAKPPEAPPPAVAPAAMPEPAPAPAPSVVAAPAAVTETVQTPSRYRVSMPPSVTLLYELRDAGKTVGDATLAWQTDGVQYRLSVDGIMGRIESEGGTDDAGIAPLRASYAYGAGSAAVAFDREQRSISFESVGRSAQDLPGSQDGATLLMQLAGIGLADPDQVQDAVDIYVGRADGAAVERYRVVGQERITTPIGAIDTLHLQSKGGLEVWLAPERGWLPVQLRMGARTQVVKEIRNAPAG
ncbi:DUF3108 domain-containing protein [Massilia sp. 9I]|uniref:DUF3108 domain-containing protein n=1 Tax=Massilia sp. 9I TaxID=2653152 RepID=UPI0012F02FEC|nr:DUF3108 domain-containing protein [Massilia sp. 9I]VXB86678.1 conserved hypothetical protein [Massilia sp. 9I]